MKLARLEKAYGKSTTRIASELTKLGMPVTKQAIHQWRTAGRIPARSAAIIKALQRNQPNA